MGGILSASTNSSEKDKDLAAILDVCSVIMILGIRLAFTYLPYEDILGSALFVLLCCSEIMMVKEMQL